MKAFVSERTLPSAGYWLKWLKSADIKQENRIMGVGMDDF